MTIDPEAWFLEDRITTALTATPPGEDHRATARRLLTTMAGYQANQWVITEVTTHREQPLGLTAVGDLGQAKADIGGCTHLYRYSNETLATDPAPNPDNTDYLHICCLDDHIAQMIALRELKRRSLDGDRDLPGCRHTCTEFSQPGHLRPCQACGEMVDCDSPPTPPKWQTLGEEISAALNAADPAQ